MLARRQQLDASVNGTVSEVFTALVLTLSFRRWRGTEGSDFALLPTSACRYRCQAGSVLRVGRIVEIIRPVGITLKEILHDPPCRVALTMRWRIEPVATGCVVRLRAGFRLNHAAILRGRHWERRLLRHFGNQFHHLDRNLEYSRTMCNGNVLGEKNVI